MALGVFCSCASDDTVDPYAQDRNVAAIDIPEIDSLVLDSIEQGLYPDSLSGWELRWAPPIDPTNAQVLYVLGDSLPANHVEALINGPGELDFNIAQLAPPLARLSVRDSVWRIPSKLLGGQGKKVRTDTVFWFSIWIRYSDGAVGPPVKTTLFFGDNLPPEVPPIDTIVGQTTFEFRFDRPRDLVSRYDTRQDGPLSWIRAIWWRGTSPKDSIRNRPETTWVSQDSVRDTSVHRIHLGLSGLDYDSPHMVVLQIADDTGNVSTVGPWPVNTRDSILPAGPLDGRSQVLSKNAVRISWNPATDHFVDGVPQRATSPNRQIRSYRILLSSPAGAPLRVVDSLDLILEDSSNFRGSVSWPSSAGQSRYRWDGTTWTWTWPNFAPGDSFRVAIATRDRSGNPAADTLFVTGRTQQVSSIRCPEGVPVVPVRGDTLLGDYCMERFEHVRGGRVDRNVTWGDAVAACQDAGGELCSEAQWQHACETVPDSPSRLTFGALEYKANPEIDSIDWVEDACGLGGGAADSAIAGDTLRRDPRCVSGWGVRDLPGQMSEWTRDVWHSRRDTLPASALADWNRAYLGPSDYTGRPDVGVLRGGSWLDIGNFAVRVSLASCRGRTYPATGQVDTMPNRQILPVPDPSGKARAWGYRCCFRPR